MKRAHTTGSVTSLPDGRLWVRAARQPDGSRPSLGYALTQDEADALLALAQVRTIKREGAPLWLDWIDRVLEIRETDGVRGIRQEKSRLLHLRRAAFARKPIDKITATDILEWVRKLKRTYAADRREKRFLDHDTVCRCLSLASAIFREAVGTHIDVNPCVGIYVKPDATVDEDEDNEEVWDWLRRDEQEKFAACEEVPEWARLLVMFAFLTGLRQGEQWNLKIRDAHLDVAKPYVFVRVGSKGKRPKSGKTRRVYLNAMALSVVKRWLELLPVWLKGPNEHELLWPTVTGKRRQSGAPEKSVRRPGEDRRAVHKVELLTLWLKTAGIERHLRWHDMRHTFCSSLASGAWGVAWTLEEIKDAAGHSSVTVTEKYAHLCETVQQKAIARLSIGYGLVVPEGTNGGASSSVAAITNDFDALDGVGRAGHDPATYGLKGQGVLEMLQVLAEEKHPQNPLVTHLAAALATALTTSVANKVAL